MAQRCQYLRLFGGSFWVKLVLDRETRGFFVEYILARTNTVIVRARVETPEVLVATGDDVSNLIARADDGDGESSLKQQC